MRSCMSSGTKFNYIEFNLLPWNAFILPVLINTGGAIFPFCLWHQSGVAAHTVFLLCVVPFCFADLLRWLIAHVPSEGYTQHLAEDRAYCRYITLENEEAHPSTRLGFIVKRTMYSTLWHIYVCHVVCTCKKKKRSSMCYIESGLTQQIMSVAQMIRND